MEIISLAKHAVSLANINIKEKDCRDPLMSTYKKLYGTLSGYLG
jgi:hypothetical protein